MDIIVWIKNMFSTKLTVIGFVLVKIMADINKLFIMLLETF